MKIAKISPVSLFFIVLIFSITVEFLVYPKTFLLHTTYPIVGIILLLISLIITLYAYQEFRNHNTPYKPNEIPIYLITTGIYRFSRNPIYLALVLSHAALGLILGSLYLMGGSFLLFVLIDRIIVTHEEKILYESFKSEFDRYKNSTARWITIN